MMWTWIAKAMLGALARVLGKHIMKRPRLLGFVLGAGVAGLMIGLRLAGAGTPAEWEAWEAQRDSTTTHVAQLQSHADSLEAVAEVARVRADSAVEHADSVRAATPAPVTRAAELRIQIDTVPDDSVRAVALKAVAVADSLEAVVDARDRENADLRTAYRLASDRATSLERALASQRAAADSLTALIQAVPKPPRRWSVGITAGGGCGPQGCGPVLAAGVHWRIW